MPVLLSSLTDEQVASFREGDEATFERIVTSHFDGLVERVRELLGDEASSAPRVALTVLQGAWASREQITSPAVFDAFLEETASRRAAEELRRRASLHRFEAHEGVTHAAPPAPMVMSASEAWQQISARLHVSEEELAEHREEVRELAKQHAREHVNSVAKRGVPWGMVGVGAVLLALVALGMRYMDRGSAEMALTRALAGEEVRTVRSFPGQRGSVALLDESTAQMAAGSTLRIPSGFGSTLRGLEMEGAAHFIVAPGKSPEFQVRARGVGIVAKGTEFDVRAFSDDPEVLVRVREGAVAVHPQAGKSASHDVAAGEAIAVLDDGTIRPLSAGELERAFSWTEGTLVLDNVTVDRALVMLSRWHDVDAILADPSLGQRTVTVRLTIESAGEALEAFTKAANLRVDYTGQQMVLRDAGEP